MQKANTEYIGVRKQSIQAKKNATKGEGQDDKTQLQERVAQRIMDTMQGRVEDACDQQFEDWTVVQNFGDNGRKCVAKVRVSTTEFVHIHCTREIRSDPWTVGYDPYKVASDALSDNIYHYQELQDNYHDVVCQDLSCAVQ